MFSAKFLVLLGNRAGFSGKDFSTSGWVWVRLGSDGEVVFRGGHGCPRLRFECSLQRAKAVSPVSYVHNEPLERTTEGREGGERERGEVVGPKYRDQGASIENVGGS